MASTKKAAAKKTTTKKSTSKKTEAKSGEKAGSKEKKLTRSQDNKMFLGVCGGIGEYIHLDPTIVRLGWIVVTALTGFFLGIIAYVIAVVVIPEE